MNAFLMIMAVFLVFVPLGIPVSFNIRLSIMAAVLAKGTPLTFVSQMAFTRLGSYAYLATPTFTPAGYLMKTDGLSERLVNFAASLVGNIHGGLGVVATLVYVSFAAISDSSPGMVAAVGTTIIPPMVEEGYDRDFFIVLTASTGSLGALILPPVPMMLCCTAGEVSIGEMFMAGFIPGFLMIATLALATYVISKENGYKSDKGEFGWKEVAVSFKEAIWPFLAPVIILGGIYSGIFTPTEAAVVIVAYSMFVGLFTTKEPKVPDLSGILYKGVVTAGTTVFILASAMVFSRYLTLNQIPQLIGSVILGITGNVHVILALSVLLCFVTGTFLETASQVLVYTPSFLPALKGLGISPLHFGILFTMGAMLGTMTPPVGINLFVAQGISGAKISKMTEAILPFLPVMLSVQILFVFFPGFPIFLSGLFSK